MILTKGFVLPSENKAFSIKAMKKVLLILLLCLSVLPLSSCGSAFDSPEKYVTLPALKDVTVSEKKVNEALDEVVKDLLENMTGEHFTTLVSPNEASKLGDRVHVSFSPDGDQGLSADTVKLLTVGEKDRLYVIPGSDTMPAALEDILVDVKVGDVLSAQITYAADDTDITELIGKTVTLTVKVHGIARLTVAENHAVKLQFTGKLASGDAPIDLLLPLLKGGVETIDLADKEDTFNEVFPSSALIPHVVGLHKFEKTEFTLTLPAEQAKDYGYDSAIDIVFEATIKSSSNTPTELTDALVEEISYGVYQNVATYLAFCRNMVKEELALQAIVDAAVFAEDMPDKEYDEFYTENYNAALYATVGDVSGYTPDQLSSMLSEEVLKKVEETAHENTVRELCERFVLEYLYDELDVKLTKEEYNQKLEELFASYQAEYYYMLYYYNITTKEALEEYLGKDYIEVQFLYEKLLPMLKDVVTFTE